MRLACLSRPGYDGSDRLPGRSFADGPADTTAVAEALGHESFYVIGHSCGGGFALADAALLPDRVRVAGVVATLAPRSASGLAWRAETRRANGEEFDALEEGAQALERFLKDQAEKMRDVKKGTDLTDNFSDLYGPADRAAFIDGG